MSIRLGILMDPITAIRAHKDSSFAMLLAAQARGWQLFYMEQKDLYLRNERAFASMRQLKVDDRDSDWFEWSEAEDLPLSGLDILLMRKDPPMDMEYLYTTFILERAELEGLLVLNRPASLRDSNEKLYTAWFPEVCSPTLVSRRHAEFDRFIDTHRDVILKPLDGMGGASVFRVRAEDSNRNVIIETLTGHGTRYTMGQRFIPEIRDGDKRIIVIDGEAIPYALARVPSAGENRGNLAAGGSGVGVALSDKDRQIVETVAPRLREQGILFAGLDVIGDYLTEVNVTSPTGIRELDKAFGLNIAGLMFDAIDLAHFRSSSSRITGVSQHERH